MLVSYFGMIKQNTGEDWLVAMADGEGQRDMSCYRTNTKLSLSTAAPNVGGTAPELKTLKINLIHPVSSANVRNQKVLTLPNN